MDEFKQFSILPKPNLALGENNEIELIMPAIPAIPAGVPPVGGKIENFTYDVAITTVPQDEAKVAFAESIGMLDDYAPSVSGIDPLDPLILVAAIGPSAAAKGSCQCKCGDGVSGCGGGGGGGG